MEAIQAPLAVLGYLIYFILSLLGRFLLIAIIGLVIMGGVLTIGRELVFRPKRMSPRRRI